MEKISPIALNNQNYYFLFFWDENVESCIINNIVIKISDKSPSIWDHFFHNNDFPIIPDNPWSAEVKTTSRSTKKVKPVILQRGININELEENHFIFKSNEKEETLNGDIACDSIHQLDEDIKNLKELGVSSYYKI